MGRGVVSLVAGPWSKICCRLLRSQMILSTYQHGPAVLVADLVFSTGSKIATKIVLVADPRKHVLLENVLRAQSMSCFFSTREPSGE